jgi:hypothetical protein
MGRPLNPRYLGMPRGLPVLMPLVRLHDQIEPAWIINQINKHSYICRQTKSGSLGVCKLADNLEHNGNMLLRFRAPDDQIFYCSRITNLFAWDFSGQKFPWKFQENQNNPQQTHACLIDSTFPDK